MRIWFVRVLLNLATLIVSGAVSVAGFMIIGSPLFFLIGVGIYLFFSWGLAQQVTRGPAQVSMVEYIGPLFLTYLLICLMGTFYLTTSQIALELNPEAPDFSEGLSGIWALMPLLQIIGGGLVLSSILMIPSVVAIIDRPPPALAGETEPALVAPDGVIAVPPPTVMGEPTQIPAALVSSTPVPAVVPRHRPLADQATTLEELFDLEPSGRV